jgi:magnesium transporter
MTRVPLFQRSRRRVKKAPGARPGTLIRAKGAHESRISALCYDAELLQEYEGITASEALAHIGQARVLWIRVQGHADLEALQHLAQALGMHGLALEDVFSLHGQPKLEDYEPGCFFLGRSVSKGEHFVSKQLALFWKQNVLLSFEEDHADAFAPIVRRLRAGKGKIRQLGTDYLAYALIDKVVDDYGPVLDAYELLLEDVEGSVLSGADSEELQHLHSMRRQVTELRRTLRPLRVAVQEAMEGRVGSFDEELRVYLRDTHDHAVQALESCDALRDMLASITDLVFSMQSQKMNDIIKVLTIISTIFIPLSFLAGLYGMNFDTAQTGNMPELRQAYAYPALLLLMGGIALLMLIWFWRRGWLWRRA